MNLSKDKRRILFRADGNSDIGLGHIYRCLAISERVHQSFDTFFAIRKPSAELVNVIGKFSWVIILDQFESYLIESEEISVKIIPEYKIDIIVLDGYYFNTEYQTVIKQKSKSVLVSIDDDQLFHYVSDIVINHAGGVIEKQISKEPYTKLYLGYDYLLLRKEFIKAFHEKRTIVAINTILICFGGADPEDFTGQMVDCLKEDNGINKIKIVVGASYREAEKLKMITAGYPNVEVLSNLDAKTLVGIMGDVELAIVPASTIGLEAFASKMILITGITAENQKSIYKGLILEDNVIGIDHFNLLTCEKLLENIKSASQKFNYYIFEKKPNNNDSILEIFKSISL